MKNNDKGIRIRRRVLGWFSAAMLKSVLMPKVQNRYILFVALVLFVGLGLSWLTVIRTDRKMRDDHLHTTRLVAESVNIESLQALSGTKADLGTPDYL